MTAKETSRTATKDVRVNDIGVCRESNLDKFKHCNVASFLFTTVMSHWL